MNYPFREMVSLLTEILNTRRRSIVALSLLLFAHIGLQLASPQAIRRFVDAAQEAAATSVLVSAALFFIVVVLAERVAGILVTFNSQKLGWSATNALRSRLLQHLLGLDMAFHHDHQPGELLQRVDGDVTRLSNFFSNLVLQIVGGVLLTFGVLVLLAREDWRIAAPMSVFVVVYVLIHFWDQRWSVPQWRKERSNAAELTGFVEERMAGVRDIRSAGAIAYTMARFYQVLRRWQWQAWRAELITDLGWGFSATFFGAGTALAMAIGAYLYLTGAITLGAVYLIVHYMTLINEPLNRIARQMEDLQRVRVSVERIRALLDVKPRIVDGPGMDFPDSVAPGVSYNQIAFAYQPGTPVLTDISFSLEPGEVLGVLGRTGSGKSTIARLLYRLYDVDQGTIHIHGKDIRTARVDELRQAVGVVTQEVQLFQATVRENLTLFDDRITDQRVREALQTLRLEPWIDGLPDGLETELGSANDPGLSAGEAQLLALARVYLKQPAIVILDEASSRLDPETERLLEGSLDRLLRGRTAIIIAHRLSTLQRADKLLVLEQGSIVEYGKRDELAADPESLFSGLQRSGLEEVMA